MATRFSGLSDEELRSECLRHNISVGPIMPTTRKVYEKKLAALADGKGKSTVVNGVRAEDSPGIIDQHDDDEVEENVYYEHESDTDYHGEESYRVLSPEESFSFHKRLTPPRKFSAVTNDAAPQQQLLKRNRMLFVAVFVVIAFLVIFFIFLSENAAKYKSDEL